jgi:hypothetical protein
VQSPEGATSFTQRIPDAVVEKWSTLNSRVTGYFVTICVVLIETTVAVPSVRASATAVLTPVPEPEHSMSETCVLPTTSHARLHAVPAAAQTAEADEPNAVAVPAAPQFAATIGVLMGLDPVNQQG